MCPWAGSLKRGRGRSGPGTAPDKPSEIRVGPARYDALLGSGPLSPAEEVISGGVHEQFVAGATEPVAGLP